MSQFLIINTTGSVSLENPDNYNIILITFSLYFLGICISLVSTSSMQMLAHGSVSTGTVMRSQEQRLQVGMGSWVTWSDLNASEYVSGVKSGLGPLSTSWTNHLISLCFIFLTCKIENNKIICLHRVV